MKHTASWSPNVSASSSLDDDQVKEHQKWDHITLSDFHSSSCWTGFSYGYLWFLAIVAIAVYAADTYTAVILLAYNRWPGQIAPAIPFTVSRWLFAACIIFSSLLYSYQWFRAFKVMRRGSVSRDYLDPLAAVLQSMRSWKRYLVFAELTKSRKGADYIALFTYFQLKGAIRILIAEGPRQAINGITLYAVMRSNLLPNGQSKGSNFDQFWSNVRVLAMQQHEHAIILFTMLFTLTIWIVSAISLLLACLSWLCFLWHYVENGNLSRFCKRKIEKRLRKIMEKTFAKEIARQESLRRAGLGAKPSRRFGSTSTTLTDMRRPTLPDITDEKDALAFTIPPISRQSTARYAPGPRYDIPPPPLPRKASMPLARQPTLPMIEESPLVTQHAFPPGRNNSSSSTSTNGTNPEQDHAPTRPLIGSAADMSNTHPNRRPSYHHPSASQSSIVLAPLSIPRKPLPIRKHSSDGSTAQPQPSPDPVPTYEGQAQPVATLQRNFSFSDMATPPPQPMVERLDNRYAPRSLRYPQQPVGRYEPPMLQTSQSRSQRQPSMQPRTQAPSKRTQGPKTFAAMGF